MHELGVRLCCWEATRANNGSLAIDAVIEEEITRLPYCRALRVEQVGQVFHGFMKQLGCAAVLLITDADQESEVFGSGGSAYLYYTA